MEQLAGNKRAKHFPFRGGGIPEPRVKKKMPRKSEIENPTGAEINPNLLEHEELLPDRKGEDQTKAHQPYEFKSWLRRHLISKWVYWL